MAENKQVFRHLADVLFFSGYICQSIQHSFQTSSRYPVYLPDTLNTFPTTSRYLLDPYKQLSSFHTSDRHLEISIQSEHLRQLLETFQTPSKPYKLTIIIETFVHASFVLVRIFNNWNMIFQLLLMGCLPNCCQTPTLQSHS